MKNRIFIGWAGAALVVLSSFFSVQPTSIIPPYPDHWPQPVYNFKDRPLNASKIKLGRHLFYDPILSVNQTISCASCHLSYSGFTHVDHDLSHGVFDSIGTRNSIALVNLAWNKLFMWDGAVNHIEVQALAPLTHPAEMGETLPNVVRKLQQSEKYRQLFYDAFKDTAITGQYLLIALAQFQLTLISSNSKYDRVMRQEENTAFTAMELNGYQLFKKHCNQCHTEPLFSRNDFASNGLPIDTTLNDYGRVIISKNPADSFRFKIPSLRNIEFTYPYMHDGRFNTLRAVLGHYSQGIQMNNKGPLSLQKGLFLTSREKTELQAFLLTLSDTAFLFNPKFSYPK